MTDNPRYRWHKLAGCYYLLIDGTIALIHKQQEDWGTDWVVRKANQDRFTASLKQQTDVQDILWLVADQEEVRTGHRSLRDAKIAAELFVFEVQHAGLLAECEAWRVEMERLDAERAARKEEEERNRQVGLRARYYQGDPGVAMRGNGQFGTTRRTSRAHPAHLDPELAQKRVEEAQLA